MTLSSLHWVVNWPVFTINITYVQVWSKSDQRWLRKTLHKQTNRDTDTTKIMVTWPWTKTLAVFAVTPANTLDRTRSPFIQSWCPWSRVANLYHQRHLFSKTSGDKWHRYALPATQPLKESQNTHANQWNHPLDQILSCTTIRIRREGALLFLSRRQYHKHVDKI